MVDLFHSVRAYYAMADLVTTVKRINETAGENISDAVSAIRLTCAEIASRTPEGEWATDSRTGQKINPCLVALVSEMLSDMDTFASARSVEALFGFSRRYRSLTPKTFHSTYASEESADTAIETLCRLSGRSKRRVAVKLAGLRGDDLRRAAYEIFTAEPASEFAAWTAVKLSELFLKAEESGSMRHYPKRIRELLSKVPASHLERLYEDSWHDRTVSYDGLKTLEDARVPVSARRKWAASQATLEFLLEFWRRRYRRVMNADPGGIEIYSLSPVPQEQYINA